MNKVLQTVYDNMINIILKDFTPEEQEEVKKAYQEYVINCYTGSLSLNDDENELINLFIYIEKIKWENEIKIHKQTLLLKDEYLEKLGVISNIAYNCALARLFGKSVDITEEEAKKYIEQMKKYSELVREFNKFKASNYLSNGIVDFYYGLGLSDNTSFRLGRV